MALKENVIIWCPMCDAGMLVFVSSGATTYKWRCEECSGEWTCGEESLVMFQERKRTAMARAFR